MSDFEPSQRYSICVTTSRAPTSSSSSSANSEAAQILCPHTGSSSNNLSQNHAGATLKTGAGVGIQTVASFPSTNNQLNCSGLYLAYAGSTKENMHAMLLSSGEGASANSVGSGGGSTLKWKCRLPEFMEAGLHISPHSPSHIFGGGRSGRAYVWSTFQNGALLKVWQAHYRPVTSISFSSCGGFVLTGGADGVVHLWNLLDLVSESSDVLHSDDINPVHTWSEHHLPVSALHSLPSNRAISVSLDRQLIIMELFNGKTIARILLPSAITSVTSDENAHRIYAGAINGTIYCIDLDTYAVSTTAESATVVSQSSRAKSKSSQPLSTSGTRLLESVLSGQQSTSNSNSSKLSSSTTMITNQNVSAPSSSYISEFRGHERKVTVLAVLEGGASMSSSLNGDSDKNINNNLLVSGGEDGTVRVWDINARCCTCIMRPWAASSTTTTTTVGNNTSQGNTCPVSCILVMPKVSPPSSSSLSLSSRTSSDQQNDVFGGMGMFSSKNQSGNDASSLMKPLQRFQQSRPQSSSFRSDDDTDTVAIITQPIKNESSIRFWNGDSESEQHKAKRFRLACSLHSHINDAPSPSSVAVENLTSTEMGQSSNSDVVSQKDVKIAKSEEEIKTLRKELEEANAMIERWQKVNSKLVSKLKKAGAKK